MSAFPNKYNPTNNSGASDASFQGIHPLIDMLTINFGFQSLIVEIRTLNMEFRSTTVGGSLFFIIPFCQGNFQSLEQQRSRFLYNWVLVSLSLQYIHRVHRGLLLIPSW